MRALIRVLPVLLLAAACSNVQIGRDFALSTFDAKVQRGMTTQAEVRAWLGAPTGVGIDVETTGERYEEWSYYFGGGTLPDLAKAHLKLLQVKFDQQGLVRAYNWSGDPQ